MRADLRESKPTKSFRDAADRIVRQESAMPESMSRLLGAPTIPTRAPATDQDAWDVRLAALASIAQYDGLTFVTADGTEPAAAYNLAADPMDDPIIQSAVDEVARSAATLQVRTSVALADGRVATAVLVTPLAGSSAAAGALLALRVGRPFAAVDSYAAVRIAEIVSLELTRALDRRRELADRAQALALYELARLALFTEDHTDMLQGTAMLLARTLEHDAVHIWTRDRGRSLQRRAAYPSDDAAADVVWENEHDALSWALHERRVVRLSAANAPWIPSNINEVLVAPLRADPGPVGILVLGRRVPAYGLDDIEMADLLGTFVGRVMTYPRDRAQSARYEQDLAPARTDVETEGELEESERAG